MVRVVVADDQPVLRYGLRQALAAAGGIEVVGEIGDGAAVIARVAALRPDVLVLEPRLAGFPGLGAIAEIRRAAPAVAVVVFSTAGGADAVRAAIRAGARGYLLKAADCTDVVLAVRTVATGGAVFCPVLGRRLHEVLSATEPPALRALTAREREVLSLIAAGHANSAIAGRLGLSPKTVSNHISAVFAKLRLATRAELIVFARENGVLAG